MSTVHIELERREREREEREKEKTFHIHTHTLRTNTQNRTLSNPPVHDSGATCLDITKARHLCHATCVRVWTEISRMLRPHTNHLRADVNERANAHAYKHNAHKHSQKHAIKAGLHACRRDMHPWACARMSRAACTEEKKRLEETSSSPPCRRHPRPTTVSHNTFCEPCNMIPSTLELSPGIGILGNTGYR